MRPTPFAVTLALLSTPAAAQNFYVDTGPGAPPSSAYGGPYGVPGTWNSATLVGGGYALVDANGTASGVTVSVLDSCDASSCDAPELDGDDAALFEDWFNGDCYASPNVVYVNGLPAGSYQLLAVGYNACDTDTNVSVRVEVSNTQIGTFPTGGVAFTGWESFPVAKVSFALTEGQYLELTTQSGGYGGLAGFQIVRLGADPVPFCFGHLGDCPCAAGDPGHGCRSSFEPAGAQLVGMGRADLDSDTLELTASGLSSSVVTFIQSDQLVEHGFGAVFGDGLRCASGDTIRLASKLAVGGVATYPEAGEDPLSIAGLIPPAGGSRSYQVWYRDPHPSWCTSGTFNLTNAVGVEWR